MSETVFSIYFDYGCKSDPKYSSKLDDSYSGAYIVETNTNNDEKVIINILDYNEIPVDISDLKNNDLIKKINNNVRLDNSYSSYDIARHNLIYTIYFGEPQKFWNEPLYNMNIYSKIRDNLSYSGKNYYYYKDGTILRECFHINGKIEGKFIGYSYIPKPDKNCEYNYTGYYVPIYEIDYVSGKIHGKYIKKNTNGQILIECNFIDGNIEGELCVNHTSGELAVKCTYIYGQIEGKYIMYGSRHYRTADKINVMVTNYMNGKENGKRTIYKYVFSTDTFILNADYDYVDGEKNGVENIYDDKGKIIETIYYVNNKKHGLRTIMDKTKYGNEYYIKIEKTYKNGKRNGINKYYNDLGQIVMTKKYKKGSVYNISKYYSTAVKKSSIDIKYDDKVFWGECHQCSKEIHTIKTFNESGEIQSSKQEEKIIEHDGYERCDDSDYEDYWQEDKFYEDNKKYLEINPLDHLLSV